MMATRDSAAYDFSLFEAREERAEQEVQAEAVSKPKAAARAKAQPAVVIRWVAVTLFIVLSLAAMMFCNVQLTKLNDQISKAQSELNAAKSEQVSLNMQLESRTSLSSVEDYAINKLGLQKTSQYQVTYVQLTDKDKVDVAPKSTNIFDRFLNFILEYL